MSDFIERAKLEAEAEKRWPLWLPTGDYEIDREDYDEESAKWQNAEAEEQRQAFLAGAAAYAALLDAETTEEWRHRRIDGNSEVGIYPGKLENRVMDWLQHEWMNESRRVLYGPWLPSEGGEKRG